MVILLVEELKVPDSPFACKHNPDSSSYYKERSRIKLKHAHSVHMHSFSKLLKLPGGSVSV